MTDSDHLRDLWTSTLGDDGGNGWSTLSGGATYRAPEDNGGTLSGGSTLGGTLSGGSTMGAAEGVSTTRIGLGGFELVEEIGRGGMGVVWRARQASLARDVAVKLIRAEASNEKSRRGFVSEALVNGVLDHPNIVPVHELGSTPDGEAFLAMKLVGGTAWDRLLHPKTAMEQQRAKTFDLDKHLGILESVANAVAFAHSRGIVHRDLKPENVMVGEYGEVLVMDWGIAVDIREKPDPADSRATPKSAIRGPAGTPSYMAPELAEGRGADIGPWTDVYLLGAILCEILRGTPPHQGNSLMAILLSASRSEPPSFPAGTPEGLITICRTALAKDHHARYATVPALQAALAEYRKHRESDLVAASARKALERCAGRDASALSGSERASLYGDYAEAVAGYRQALSLWAENATARAGEADARRGYALAALGAGDLALAEAQSAPLGDTSLTQRIAAATQARSAREAAAKRNRLLLVGALGVIVVGLAIGVALVTGEQRKTAEQRDLALANEAEAKAQRDAATAAAAQARDARAINAIDGALTLSDVGRPREALAALVGAMDGMEPGDARRAEAWRLHQLIAWGAQREGEPVVMPPPKSLDGKQPFLSSGNLGDDGRLYAVWSQGDDDLDRSSVLVVATIDGNGRTETVLPGLRRAHALHAGHNGIVIAGSVHDDIDGGVLVCMDPKTGMERWRRELSVGGGLAPVDREHVAFVGSSGGLVLRIRDGAIVDHQVVPTGSTWSPQGRWHVEAVVHRNWYVDDRYGQTVAFDVHRAGGEGAERRISFEDDEIVRALLPSADGRCLVALVSDGSRKRLLQYDILTGRLIQEVAGDLDFRSGLLAVDAGGARCLVASPEGTWRIFGAGSTPERKTEPVPAGIADAIPVGMDLSGRDLVVQRPGGLFRAGLVDGSQRWQATLGEGERCVGLTIDRRALVTDDGVRIRILAMEDGRELVSITQPSKPLEDDDGEGLTAAEKRPVGGTVALSQDGSCVLVLGLNGLIWGRYAVGSGEPLPFAEDGGYDFNVSRRYVRIWASGGRHLFSSFEEEAGSFGTPISRSETVLLGPDLVPGHRILGSAARGLPGGDDRVMLDQGGSLGWWDLATGQRQRSLPAGSGSIFAVSPDGSLAATSTGNRLLLWERAGGRSLGSIPLRIAIDPDEYYDNWSAMADGERLAWRLLDGGSELRRVANGGIERIHLIPSTEPPARISTLRPTFADLVTRWEHGGDRPAVRKVDAAAFLDYTEIPSEGVLNAALRLLAMGETERVHLSAATEVVERVQSYLTERDRMAKAKPRLGSQRIQEDERGSFADLPSQMRVRFVPPGTYSWPDGGAVQLTYGFWITTGLVDAATWKLLVPEDLVPDSTEDRPRIGRAGAQRLRTAEGWRLPRSAELVAARSALPEVQEATKTTALWIADGWSPDGRPARDPADAWNRLDLAIDAGKVVIAADPSLTSLPGLHRTGGWREAFGPYPAGDPTEDERIPGNEQSLQLPVVLIHRAW